MRILPYAGNLVLFFWYFERSPSWSRFPGTRWLVLVFALMSAELLHPDSTWIPGGGQVIFCTSIFAPAFWGGKVIRDKRRLDRILYFIFFFNAASALVGFIQTKYDLLMPAQFSSLITERHVMDLQALMYTGANGQNITRPPGLSDVPGAASTAAAYAVILGTALALGLKRFGVTSVVYLLVVAISAITLYLTQVRIAFIMAVIGLILTAWGVARHSIAYAARISLAGGGLLAVALMYAVSIGGTSVSDRFATLVSASPGETYQENRGHFVQDTINELLPEYLFGAGLGRWGMERVYASAYIKDTDPPAIWVEIQMTGWLLDGGFLMWIFYGAAILSSLAYTYKKATGDTDRDVRYLAAIVLTLNLTVVVIMFDSPAFNNQTGSQFWLLSSGLAGVCETRTSGKDTI
jgi:hypothetical protein